MLYHARHIGLTDDDLDYLTDSQLEDLAEIDAWAHGGGSSGTDRPSEVVHHMTPEEVDRQMGL